jgi:hypothetical protein
VACVEQIRVTGAQVLERSGLVAYLEKDYFCLRGSYRVVRGWGVRTPDLLKYRTLIIWAYRSASH